MKRLLIILLFFLAAIGGCGTNITEDPLITEDEAGGDLKSVQVVLDWYPNAVHTFLYTAIEEGYFEQEGLNVDLIVPADPNDSLKLTAAGIVDFGLTYQTEVVKAHSEGVGITSVASIFHEPYDNNYNTLHNHTAEPNISNELVLVTNDDYLHANRETINAFWRAASNGLADVRNNTEQAINLLLANQDEANFPLDRDTEEQNLRYLLSKIEDKTEDFGSQHKESWQDTINWLLKNGYIDRAPDPKSLFIDLMS